MSVVIKGMWKKLIFITVIILLLTVVGCSAITPAPMRKNMIDAMHDPGTRKEMIDSMMRSAEGRKAMTEMMKSKEMRDAMVEMMRTREMKNAMIQMMKDPEMKKAMAEIHNDYDHGNIGKLPGHMEGTQGNQ